jgi:hypothetical protein
MKKQRKETAAILNSIPKRTIYKHNTASFHIVTADTKQCVKKIRVTEMNFLSTFNENNNKIYLLFTLAALCPDNSTAGNTCCL